MNYPHRCRALLEGTDGIPFLVINLEDSDHVSLFYLTGFTGEGALLLCQEEAILLTDSRYTEQAKREVPDLSVKEVKGKYLSEVAELIRSRAIKRVAIASKRASHFTVERLRELSGADLTPLEDPVACLRRRKDADEIKRIRQASQLAEASLEEILTRVKIGMSEREVALQLEWIMRAKGAEKGAFDLIIAAGENSALPHYRPNPGIRKLKPGELLLFDIGAQLDGYCSDMTRVVALGEVPVQAREVYDLVFRANRAGLAALRAGRRGVDVDAAARDVIAKAGYKERFGHGLGHGVGLEVHEGPSLSPLSEDTLEANMVVTVEPGVYLPGFGGVRIEELVVVTNDGCDVLTNFPCDRLIEVG